MHTVLELKAKEVFALAEDVFSCGSSMWITVTGMSMYPFLREGKDQVELYPASYEQISYGDIVLIQRETGEFVLHRIIKKKSDCFYMVGDAQQWIEGPLRKNQLKAVVKKIKRQQRIINCNNPLLIVLVRIWILMLPFRYKLIKLNAKIKKLFSNS